MTALNSAYSFVKGAEPLRKIESRREVIDRLVAETTECAYFLRDYLSETDFSMNFMCPTSTSP
jgi:hypothetical protein